MAAAGGVAGGSGGVRGPVHGGGGEARQPGSRPADLPSPLYDINRNNIFYLIVFVFPFPVPASGTRVCQD